jgi:hypothetical protein
MEQLRLNREPHEHIVRPNASYNMKDHRSPYWARTRLRKPITRKTKKVRKHPKRK